MIAAICLFKTTLVVVCVCAVAATVWFLFFNID
jgi:hypothetical protein